MPDRRTLLVLRTFYFLNYGGLGALFPLLPLLLEGRHLTPEQISWVMVLVPLCNLLMPPLWGIAADALQARVVLLRLAAFASGLATLLLVPDWGFWGAVLAIGVFSIFRSPVASLVDAATSAAMGARQVAFGRVRVWGSVGFTVFVLAMGYLRVSDRPPVLLWTSSAVYMLSAFVALALRAPPVRREPGVLRECLGRLARPALLLILCGNLFYYLGHAIFDAYFSLHLKHLGFGDRFISSAWAIGVTAEVIVMFAAPLLLPRARASSFLCVAGVCAVLRWGTLSLTCLPPAALLATQSLHGITFGLWYLSLVRFVQSTAPERLRTSLQSIALSTFGGGSVVGYLVGGVVLQRYGGARTFQLAGAGAAMAFVLYLVARVFDRSPVGRDPSGSPL
jgi:MFS transporter, PPP family, 3-phenylpropionic acid transporter